MQPDKTPPCEPSKLLLQRRLQGDSARWRTVLRIIPAQMRIVSEWVAVAQRIDATVEWRLTTALGHLVSHEGQ